jgi:hypothetical protein
VPKRRRKLLAVLDSLTIEHKPHLKTVNSTSGVFHIEIERPQHPGTVQTKCACCLSTFTVPASTLSDGTIVLADPAGVFACAGTFAGRSRSSTG